MGDQRKISIKIVTRLTLFVAVLSIIIGAISNFTLHNNDEFYEHPFEQNWTLSKRSVLNEKSHFDPKFLVGKIHKNDKLILENFIPQINGSEPFCMVFTTSLSSVEVYIDDDVIYCYGKKELGSHKMAGSGFHIIPIPRSFCGHPIKLIIRPSIDNAFTEIDDINIIYSSLTTTYLIRQRFPSYLISNFLFVLGNLLFISGIFLILVLRRLNSLIFNGALCLFSGIWLMAHSHVLQLFSPDITKNTELEYFSMYICFMPFFFIVVSNLREKMSCLKKVMLICVLGANILFTVISTILHFNEILFYPSLLWLFHLIAFLSMLTLMLLEIRHINELSPSARIMYFSIIYMSLTTILDIVRYNVQKYSLTSNGHISEGIMAYALIAFVFMTIINFAVSLYIDIAGKFERETLKKLAYHDKMTGLYNRAKADVHFQKLDQENNPYKLMSIDLNGLKKTNDTYGHQEGDALIRGFARVLKKVFGQFASVYRMGGDEFMVVLKESDSSKIALALENMVMLEKKESEDHLFEMDASYGIADSSEIENGNAEAVYKLADKRMYEMKVRLKKNRTD